MEPLSRAVVALWVVTGILLLNTFSKLVFQYIATFHRVRWHRELQRIWNRHHMADPQASAPDGSIPMVPITKTPDTNDFVRPRVGWKTAYVAAVREETGLRELFV